jgi:hypothetical protein
MSAVPVSTKTLWINALSVVPDTQPEFGFVVPDFHFDLARLCMMERIAHRLRGDPVHFVSQDRRQISRHAFHGYSKDGRILVGRVGRELFSDRMRPSFE